MTERETYVVEYDSGTKLTNVGKVLAPWGLDKVIPFDHSKYVLYRSKGSQGREYIAVKPLVKVSDDPSRYWLNSGNGNVWWY